MLIRRFLNSTDGARSGSGSRAIALAAMALAVFSTPLAAETSPHAIFPDDYNQGVPSADAAERAQLEAEGKLFPLKAELAAKGVKAAQPVIDKDFIVFGYAQSTTADTYTDFYRWEALTHVGSTFIEFDNTGDIINPNSWINRDDNLRAGGAAQAAGTKVILVMLNDGFDVTVINDVMTNPTARATLISEIAGLLLPDTYAHGVSFDFEPFSWTSAARDGMISFFADLRTTLGPNYEISIYADPTPSLTQWNIPAFEPNLDYIIYSCYDYASGATPHAISDFNNYITQINNFYLDAGLPASKMVAAISTYSRRWSGTTTYDVTGDPVVDGVNPVAGGFTDGLYETTLWPQFGGPQTENYELGDEASWHTWNDSGTNYVRTWDSPRSVEYKFRHALSNQDPTTGNDQAGKRLGGVAFWSLIWTAETQSYDPIAAASVGKTRMYPHVFQIAQEALAAPGTTKFVAAGFEGLNFRWRDPNEGPDDVGDTDTNSARAIVTAPAGAGRPASTTNAMQVTYDFESAGANRLFFRHEPLASPLGPTVLDHHAVAAVFDSTTRVTSYVHTSAANANVSVRLVVMDANNQLEMSNPYTLSAAGWNEIAFDLTDPAQVNAMSTTQPLVNSGDGVINTAGGGAKDIAFMGFLIEANGAQVGNVTFDEVSYEHANPGARVYTINEFAYRSDAGEFIEIYGTPGATTPAGLQVRVLSGADGTVLKTIDIGGVTFGADGIHCVGDPAVAGVDSSTGFGNAVNDLPGNTTVAQNNTGLQVYDPNTGAVYDSVVYEAFGGIGDLIRLETLAVTGEGFPWLGEIAGGHSYGRYPDGSDSNLNSADFRSLPQTPGLPNSTNLSALPVAYNFSTAPASAVLTYPFASAGSVASGVGASPGGGNVYRVADSGGGNMAFFNDALTAGENGYRVTGRLYIPGDAEPAQAIGIGICGTLGTTFFEATPSDTGYENGYWLLYQNTAAAAINNGLGAHNGVFKFVSASNDNMDDEIVSELASVAIGSTGATAGAWTTFLLEIDPDGNSLRAEIGGTTVYTGTIPEGGRISGAFVAGHRENHTGGTAANEGTWLDDVLIQPLGTGVEHWRILGN
jgi:hypothetical protein